MNKRMMVLIGLLLCVFPAFAACGDDDDDNDSGSPDIDDDSTDDDTQADDDANDDIDDDADDDVNDDLNDDADDDTYWEPSSVVNMDVYPPVRDYDIYRGIIHLHSVYSHDACDSMPFINGHPNWNCLEQLRETFCTTNQQYIMLTDHAEPFNEHEFPDVLLYDEDAGDELIYEGDDPIANIISCPDGNTTLLMAGNENDLMPLGFHRMPEGTAEERRGFLRGSSEDVVLGMQDMGASVFVNHAEGWETDDLAALPIDGIEIYNLHANIDPDIAGWGIIIDVVKYLLPFSEAGHADLVLLSFLRENAKDLEHLDKLLGMRRTAIVMATDAHRNSLPFPLHDGDRADSYRRMMRWFANYALLEEMTPEAIQEAILSGRLYGAFQVFGEAVGFDFYAQTTEGAYEMGDEAPISESPVLHVKVPYFFNMNPALDEPEFLLTLIKSGEYPSEIVAESTNEDIEYTVAESGVYRAEVHVIPHHLAPWLGGDADYFIREYPLVYANPIYVTP